MLTKWYLLLTLIFLTGCDSKPKLRMATASDGATYNQIGKALAQAWTHDDLATTEIQQDKSLASIKNCAMVLRGETDFAICQNDTRIDLVQEAAGPDYDASALRTVMPLYPEICFIVYKDSIAAQSLRELIVGRKVAIGPITSGTSKFMKRLFAEYGIDSSEYTPQYCSFAANRLSDTVDISCSLTGFNNPKIAEMLNQGGKLFSLDDITYLDKGSSAEGFCMNYPRARPYVIPRRTYGRFPAEPVATVAVDAILVTHKDTDPFLVYDLMESIFKNKPTLANANPLLGALSEEFSVTTLNYPLHEGTENYLERSKPSFLERYAEVMGFLLTAFVVLFSSIGTFTRWNRQRKKNRVDKYYHQILAIEQEVRTLDTAEDCTNRIERIRLLKQEAFDELIDEKLMADESFRIFIQLANDTLSLLRERRAELA